ncbi:MAG: 4Fe-4S dicluster domain-containing protein [Coriobacteriales bacterium]|jgi:Fe-S-cluster-containing hydrogenase component 2
MGAESRMLGVLDRLSSGVLNAYPYRCAVMRNRNASCALCAQACTSGAISMTDDEVVVDEELCVGCGTCATVCPTCALEANDPCDAELRAQARAACAASGGMPVVACDRAWERAAGRADPERVARVRCLGRVDESLLVGLVADDGATSVRLACADCEQCPRRAGAQTLDEVVDTANLLLETWGSPVRVEVVGRVPKDALLPGRPAAPLSALPYDQTRREALSRVGSAGLSAVVGAATDALGVGARGGGPQAGASGGRAQAAAFMKTMRDGTLPHFIPDRRERLLDSLAALGEPADAALETRLWGHVTIDVEACRTCFMCATFCPTGAIARFRDEDGSVGIDHTPADCVKCRCCVDVCPTGALSLREDVMAGDISAGAVAEHVVMPPIRDGRGTPHQMLGAIKKLMKTDCVYER